MDVRLGALGLALLIVAACRTAGDEEPAALQRITLAPREARRSVGEAQRFTATGHYAGGATRNLTQRVEYVANDPAVVAAPNVKGDRSRVEAVAAGSARISAVDRKTGISSQASGDDAVLIVLGALERITLAPARVRRELGQSQRLTATGHYAGGTTRNLTQHVEYRSSDAAVVTVPNGDGDRSRIDAVGVGSATVSAIDPASGITTSAAGGDVLVTVTAVGDRRGAPSPTPSR